MNTIGEEYIARLEDLIIRKDAIIDAKERQICDLLKKYIENDKHYQSIINDSYRRYEAMDAMLAEKDNRIIELVDQIIEKDRRIIELSSRIATRE